MGGAGQVEDFGWTFGQTPDLKRNWPSNMSLGGNLHLFKVSPPAAIELP